MKEENKRNRYIKVRVTEGEERDRAECVYIQLTHRLDECSDEDE